MQRIKKREARAVVAGKVDVWANLQKISGLGDLLNLENRKWKNEGLGISDRNGLLRPKLSALSTEIFIGCGEKLCVKCESEVTLLIAWISRCPLFH
jgi:hypothetical protein